jgi:hypothetical protein
MWHLLGLLVQGVCLLLDLLSSLLGLLSFLVDLCSLLASWRIVVCLLASTAIAVVVGFQIPDHGSGLAVAVAIFSIGVCLGLIWDKAREEKRRRRLW